MGIIPCEIPLLEFDPEQTAVIGPDYEQLDLHLPRKCVFAFLGGYTDRYAHAAGPDRSPPSGAPLGGCSCIRRTALPMSSATTSATGAAAPMNTPSPCASTPFWPSDPDSFCSADAKEALMNHTVHIRSVKTGDAPQLAHIQTESWKAAFQQIIPIDILSEYTDPESVTRMYEHLLTHGIAHGYILELDGAPHGIAWWDAAREPDMSGTAELICIHSLPAHWHQGYGKLLLEKVLRDVKSAGYSSILLWVFDANLPAIRFYRSLGFTASGRKRPSFGSVEEMYTKTL